MDRELLAEINRLTAIIERSPRNADFRTQLAMVYQANGLPRLALTCYEQALDLGGPPARLWYLKALALERLSELDLAVTALERAMAHRNAPEAAAWRRAQWLIDLGRFDEAQQQLRDNLAQRPDEAATWYTLAELHIARRDADRAVQILQQQGLLEGANAGPAHQLLATAYRQLGMDEHATAAAARASTAAPTWPDAVGAELADHLLGAQRRQLTVARLMRQHRYDHAIPLLEELLRDDPTDQRTLNLLGTCHLRSGRIEPAVSLFRRAATAHPNHFGSNLNLASALWRITPPSTHALNEALRHADIAIELRPTAAEAHEMRGVALAALHQYEPAIESLKRAFAFDQRDLTLLLRVARLQREMLRWSDAADTYSDVLERQSNHGGAMIGLATCLLELHRYNEADAIINRLVQQVGSDVPEISALLAMRDEMVAVRLHGPGPLP